MDPNLLKHIDYFAVPNAQTVNPVDQNAESSAANAAQGTANTSVWDPPVGLVEPGVSDEFTTGASFAQLTSTAPTNLTYGTLAGPSPYSGGKSTLPARTAQSAAAARKRDGHERKRAKVNSDAAALESVDYWIRFDDDEPDKGGSFEIDFSKRQNASSNYIRPPSSMNTMASTPGLGTGLYSSSSASHLKDDDIVDDSALDNALSDDDDGLDSINMTDELSKIETMPPSEVPPREGLYSTPLSWEKPQPGLRTDPLLGGMSPSAGGGGAGGGAGALSDLEQRKLFAIAMNTGRPQQPAYPSGYGGGFGFGYPGLGGGFPTLGAQNLMDPSGLGTASMREISNPLEDSKPQQSSQQPQRSQTQAQAQLLAQVYAHAEAQAQAHAQNQGQGQDHQDQSQDSLGAKLEDEGKEGQRPQLQRSNTEMTDSKSKDKDKDKGKTGDRTAHNDIERKYRTNLKDKISELRDAVPALRAIPEEGGDEGDEGSTAPQRAPKVSKGTVLTKATEYIHFLERRNKAVLREHQELTRRLQAFEQLLNATARQPFPMPSYSRTLFDPRGFC